MFYVEVQKILVEFKSKIDKMLCTQVAAVQILFDIALAIFSSFLTTQLAKLNCLTLASLAIKLILSWPSIFLLS